MSRMDRRSFLKLGSLLVAAAAVAPELIVEPRRKLWAVPRSYGDGWTPRQGSMAAFYEAVAREHAAAFADRLDAHRLATARGMTLPGFQLDKDGYPIESGTSLSMRIEHEDHVRAHLAALERHPAKIRAREVLGEPQYAIISNVHYAIAEWTGMRKV